MTRALTEREDQRIFQSQIQSQICEQAEACRTIQGIATASVALTMGVVVALMNYYPGALFFGLIGSTVVALVFWATHARYHSDQRKLYRLNEAVKEGAVEPVHYHEWDYSKYAQRSNNFIAVWWSWSVWPMYLTLIAVIWLIGIPTLIHLWLS